jgi:hypothetical protein
MIFKNVYLEVCDKEANVEVAGTATTFRSKRRL